MTLGTLGTLGTPGVGFPLFVGVTLALLGAVVWTGYHGRRPVHIAFVVTAVSSLGVTIFFAEKLGGMYDLEAAGWIYPVHLFIAKTCTAAYVVPVVTGIMTIKNPAKLRLHRIAAFTVLGLTLLTAITGTLMLLASERLQVTEAEDAGPWPSEVRASERATSIPR